ncbi:methylated-DNA--[protein]-cysteine S-methyltransferase [Glutamicibacter creatinolyticus]|uniref:methylated-DNA--[protein]-cysteine S-methyltransferase n=1 Tax=Glutamicibacter creatinolyticus TaxID=162496 RepID=UPI0037C1A1F6
MSQLDGTAPLNTPPTEVEQRLLASLHDRLEQAAHREHLTDAVYRIVQSPLGPLLVAATEVGLVRVAFASEEHERVLEQLSESLGARILRSPSALDTAARQLEEYFSGHRTSFTLPLDLRLSTEFRRRVQLELGHIRYGHTLSYRQMAERIGKPAAVRAVGSACATNPLPIVLPCHRVLRTDGSLGGYLGGLQAKRILLQLENPNDARQPSTLF